MSPASSEDRTGKLPAPSPDASGLSPPLPYESPLVNLPPPGPRRLSREKQTGEAFHAFQDARRTEALSRCQPRLPASSTMPLRHSRRLRTDRS